MVKPSPRASASAKAANDLSGQDADGDRAGHSEGPEADGGRDGDDVAQELSFREAQTALELCLAQLQDQDLDVEAMAGLYRRALAYADRCEAVLARVEQQVMQWDPGQPDLAPTPYTP
ncbi:exodeoxyribonuclease VII small subunit [Cyanobium gracile]|uniref:Exodeoxyribonuclease VII small subunit n=1 Tax=Cyanobium gracile (strain ATCC 27147 / PCC 6307) TaxID=292564 RepID=K9P6Z6_CYAGP|nr:exodeoxyribonuclease VII small subunit [Cyanobium gracile]AFY28748.1 exonuclease VII small subunit [Cyanobium gracile PCC 6307]